MTGRGRSPTPGVNTLTTRQSSPEGWSWPPSMASVGDGFWGAMRAKAVASRTPGHGSTASGARNRAARA